MTKKTGPTITVYMDIERMADSLPYMGDADIRRPEIAYYYMALGRTIYAMSMFSDSVIEVLRIYYNVRRVSYINSKNKTARKPVRDVTFNEMIDEIIRLSKEMHGVDVDFDEIVDSFLASIVPAKKLRDCLAHASVSPYKGLVGFPTILSLNEATVVLQKSHDIGFSVVMAGGGEKVKTWFEDKTNARFFSHRFSSALW